MKEPTQLDKFKKTARDLDCDESEEAFAEKLKRVAKPTDHVSSKDDKGK